MNISLALYFFNQISRYPRRSRQEGQLRDFLVRWARSHSYRVTVDKTGNCVIGVPASPEKEDSPPLALQAHLDMVCEVAPGHRHDFSKEPIVPQYRGDWVRAPNTTLGADNGIGIALAMALCEDPLVRRPPLELVFTIDEETGLTGAAGLEAKAIKADYLLNLDSEDDAILITGCAGGVNISLSCECEMEGRQALSARSGGGGGGLSGAPVWCGLHISGFPGGHSGVDIDKELGNALCCGAEVARALMDEVPNCYIGALRSGTVHNAIPREFRADVLFASDGDRRRAERIIDERLRQYAARHELVDDVRFSLTESERKFNVRTRRGSAALLSAIAQLPHGVKSYTDNPSIPQTSSNVAHIAQERGRDSILISVRSSQQQEMEAHIATIAAVAAEHQLQFNRSGEYPAWHPRPHSHLLAKCRQAYHHAHGSSPRVEVIHAGLEPAVISKIIPRLDMVSCGPLILNPHSPQERFSISSTAKVYRMLVRLLQDW